MPCRRAVVLTSNDESYLCAERLAECGVEIVAILDTRAGGRVRGSAASGAITLAAAIVETRVHHSKMGSRK